ncbi:MAG: hypothetical protein MSA13_06475 [Prevotella sp.]|nr:hypothetical protein [Prevotella sp.]
MKKITKFFLALSVVGSMSLTSCKDYEEDGVTNQAIDNVLAVQAMKKELTQRINDLATKLELSERNCNQVAITKNNDGSYTFTDKYGQSVTVSGQMAENPKQDSNGFYYIVDGNGNKVYIPQVVTEGGKTYIVIGDQKYEMGAGGTTTEVSIKDNNDGTVTIKVGNESTTVTKKPTSVTTKKDADNNDVIVIQYYNADGSAKGNPVEIVVPTAKATKNAQDIAAIIKNLYGEGGTAENPKEGSLFYRMKDQENVSSDILEELYGEGGSASDPKEGSLVYRMNQVEDRLDNLEAALKKLVTGVIVQDVVNPAFGSYSSLLTNMQTTMLVGYHGEIASSTIFPNSESVDPVCRFWPGDVSLEETPGNAGLLYLTINPNTVDFTGLTLDLVDSNDDLCAITLGAARKATYDDPELTFGFTRSADDNGLYIVPATLSKSAVNDEDLKINIPADTYKKFASDLISVNSKSDLKPVMKDIAEIAVKSAQALKMPKYGVKCSWDDNNGTHSVYSQYNIAAVSFQPLGFYTVDGIFAEGGQYWRGYDKAKSLITRLAKKAGRGIVSTIDKQLGLDKISTDLGNISVNRIKEIKLTDEQRKQLKVTFELDTTLYVHLKVNANADFSQALDEMEIYTEYEIVGEGTSATIQPVESSKKTIKYLKDEDAIKVNASVDQVAEGGTGISTFVIHFKKAFTVDMTGTIDQLLGGINDGFADTNEMLDALEVLMKDANDMIANIRKMEAKVESGAYVNRIYKYLDKIAEKVGVYAPMLFKPVLLMDSDSGFGLVGTYGAPSTVTTTNVTLIPTTYSAELISPIFKKYIRVNGGEGQLVTDKTVDVTLRPGMNKIEFYALDYQGKQYPVIGNDEAAEYYINVK